MYTDRTLTITHLSQSEAVERVREYVRREGIDALVRILPPESTKTSSLAAETLGCTVAEIAKTIGFINRGNEVKVPVLVTLSGSNRVSLERLGIHLGVPTGSIQKMSAEEVKSQTGYSIGGVPPFPHNENVRVFADESLFRFRHVWAAAGANNSVMRIDPSVLTGQLKLPIVNVSEQN